MRFDEKSPHELSTEAWTVVDTGQREWRLGFSVKNRETAIAMMEDRKTWDFLVKRHAELERDAV